MKKTTIQKLAILLLFVTGILLFSACQKPVTKTFIYKYNDATGNNTVETVTLQKDKLQNATLVVPVRAGYTFDGWYLDWLHETRVSDSLGNLTIGQEIFDSNSERLYAKWTAIEQITYKILMVFVTETKATLESNINGVKTNVEVDYTMSELEKQICEIIAPMMTQYLNAMLNGLVTFEIDNYFTTVPTGEESITAGIVDDGGGAFTTYSIFANNIPELAQNGLLDEYRSVMTTFGMNDYDSLLHFVGGTAVAKYASMHVESVFIGLLVNHELIETLLDMTYPGTTDSWISTMDHYIHEFTHTVEAWNVVESTNYGIDFHDTLGYYSFLYHDGTIDYHEFFMNYNTNIETARLFLLRQAEVDGHTVGVPLWFWKNEIATLTYSTSGYGYISWIVNGNAHNVAQWTQQVPFGGDGYTVTANASDGWKFVGWSDGVTSATRTDKNRYSDLNVTAYFEQE